MNECILSRRFELFVFSHSRLFHTYFALSPRLSSHSVFNLSLFPFSFYLTPLLPSYTALGNFSLPPLFSCHSSPVRQNLRSLLFPSPSFFLLIRRLRRSLSIRRRSRRRFLYCICSPVSPCFHVAVAAAPISLQVFHARKRAFSYFSPFSARSSQQRTRPRDPPPATWHFPFSFSVCTLAIRYVIRSTLSSYCPFPPRAKCIPQASSPVFRAVLFCPLLRVYSPRSSSRTSSNSRQFVTSPDGRSSKIRYARFPPITRVNSGTQLENGEPQDRRARQTAMAIARWSANPPVKQYSTKFL